MKIKTVDFWHQIVVTKNLEQLNEILDENVVFYSPVVHTPQAGKDITKQYLQAAFYVLFNSSFKYVREVINKDNAVLEFTVEIDGIQVNGVDIITWDKNGRITEFKVMLRPLKAINLIHQKMGAMLEGNK